MFGLRGSEEIMAGLRHVPGSFTTHVHTSTGLALNTHTPRLANKHNNQHKTNAIHALSERMPRALSQLVRGLRNMTEGVDAQCNTPPYSCDGGVTFSLTVIEVRTHLPTMSKYLCNDMCGSVCLWSLDVLVRQSPFPRAIVPDFFIHLLFCLSCRNM